MGKSLGNEYIIISKTVWTLSCVNPLITFPFLTRFLFLSRNHFFQKLIVASLIYFVFLFIIPIIWSCIFKGLFPNQWHFTLKKYIKVWQSAPSGLVMLQSYNMTTQDSLFCKSSYLPFFFLNFLIVGAYSSVTSPKSVHGIYIFYMLVVGNCFVSY